jgi:hypothetical protein
LLSTFFSTEAFGELHALPQSSRISTLPTINPHAAGCSPEQVVTMPLFILTETSAGYVHVLQLQKQACGRDRSGLHLLSMVRLN